MPESTGGELLVVSAVSLTSISPLDMFVPYNRRHITPHVHRSASGSNLNRKHMPSSMRDPCGRKLFWRLLK